MRDTLKESLMKQWELESARKEHLFAQSLDENTYAKEEEEMKLHIRAQMPLGGSVHELNEKVSYEKFGNIVSEERNFEIIRSCALYFIP